MIPSRTGGAEELQMHVLLVAASLVVIVHDASGGRTCTPKDVTLDPGCHRVCGEVDNTYCRDLCVCVVDPVANDSCAPLDFAPNGVFEIYENMTVGTPLFEIPVTQGEEWTYSLGRTETVDGTPRRALESFLKFRRFGNKYEMVMDKQLDLEEVYNEHGIKLTALKLILTCTFSGTQISQSKNIFLSIRPVNEWAPEFKNLPLHNSIPENTAVGKYVFILRSQALDRDVNPSTAELSSFQLWKYWPDPRRDGRSYFGLNDTQMGSIILLKPLDYETLSSVGATKFFLNVSASDVHHLTTFTTLTLDVKDVDDLPPEFYHPGCPLVVTRSKPCLVSYEARVPVGYKGEITNMSPGRVHARDMDSLNASIEYSLESSPGEEAEILSKFAIHKTTGFVHVVSPFLTERVVEVVIVAREVTKDGRSTQASLEVTTFLPSTQIPINQVEPKLESKTTNSDTEGLPTYMLITISLGLVFLIVHVIICLVCLKLKKSGQENMRVAPHEPSGDILYFAKGLRDRNSPMPPLQTVSHIHATEYEVDHKGHISQSRMSLRYTNQSLTSGIIGKARSDGDATVLRLDRPHRRHSTPTILPASAAGMERQTADNALDRVSNLHQQPVQQSDSVNKRQTKSQTVDESDYSSMSSSTSSSSRHDVSDNIMKHAASLREGQDNANPSTTADGRSSNNNHVYITQHETSNVQNSNYRHPQTPLSNNSPDQLQKSQTLIETGYQQEQENDEGSGDATVDSLDHEENPTSTSMTDVSEVDTSSPRENVTMHTDNQQQVQRKENVIDSPQLIPQNNDVLSFLTLERASLLSGESGRHKTRSSQQLNTRIDDKLDVHGNVSIAHNDTDYLMARPYTGPGNRIQINVGQAETNITPNRLENVSRQLSTFGSSSYFTQNELRPHTNPSLSTQYAEQRASGVQKVAISQRPETGLPIERKKRRKKEKHHRKRETRYVCDADLTQNDINPMDEVNARRVISSHTDIDRQVDPLRHSSKRPQSCVRPDRSRLQPYMVLQIEKQRRDAVAAQQYQLPLLSHEHSYKDSQPNLTIQQANTHINDRLKLVQDAQQAERGEIGDDSPSENIQRNKIKERKAKNRKKLKEKGQNQNHPNASTIEAQQDLVVQNRVTDQRQRSRQPVLLQHDRDRVETELQTKLHYERLHRRCKSHSGPFAHETDVNKEKNNTLPRQTATAPDREMNRQLHTDDGEDEQIVTDHVINWVNSTH